MGLVLGVFAFVATIAVSFFALIAEAAADPQGLKKPVVTRAIFIAGTVFSSFLIVTHFYPIHIAW